MYTHNTRSVRQRQNAYRIEQYNGRTWVVVRSIAEVDFSLPLHIDCESHGFGSLLQFIYDVNSTYVRARYQFLFRGLHDPNLIIASTPVLRIDNEQMLRRALQAVLESISQRGEDSWQLVRRYFGLGDEDVIDLDMLFAQPIIVHVETVAYGGCYTRSEGEHVNIINGALSVVTKLRRSTNNNCAFDCLRFFGIPFDSPSMLRRLNGLGRNSYVSAQSLENISVSLGRPLKVIQKGRGGLLRYVTTDECVNIKIAPDHLVLLKNNHYSPIVDFRVTERQRCTTCARYYVGTHKCREQDQKNARYKFLKSDRRNAFFDIETRAMLDKPHYVKDKPFYPQAPVLACLYIPSNNEELVFEGLNCIDDFLAWIVSSKFKYAVRAHNGGCFDYYPVLAAILRTDYTREDFSFDNLMIRGSSKILCFTYKEHKFFDTYNHLADSLDGLCNSFKVKNKKIDEIICNGTIWKTKDIMLLEKDTLDAADYLPRLEELGLKEAYIKYCMYDCKSLAEIWDSYSKATCDLYSKVLPQKKPDEIYVEIQNCLTVPALAKKGWQWKMTELEYELWEPKKGTEHYKGCYNAVIGGISHVQHQGLQKDLACLDVVSLYVWAMMRNTFPFGAPIDTMVYVPGKLGVYKCKSVTCNDDPIMDVPTLRDGILDWTCRESEDRYLASIDIDRIRNRGGTVIIESGFYWEEQRDLFSDFLDPFTQEKMRQDVLKASKSPDFNVAIRNVSKLTGNSLYGKMLERIARMVLSIVDHPNDLFGYSYDYSKCFIYCANGKYMIKTPSTDENKSPFHIGVFILAYSRDHMMGIFDMVGRENIVATETDSLYIPRHLVNRLEPIIGAEIGMLDLEIPNIIESYFLGKKAYAIRYKPTFKNDELIPFEGKPVKIIASDDDTVTLYNKSILRKDDILYAEKFRLKGVQNSALYWDKYVECWLNGEVTFNDIQVFTRHLFDEESNIKIGVSSKKIKIKYINV